MAVDVLDYTGTVPRALVHRASVTEVFLTDHRPHGEGALIAAQLPRTHSYYNDHTGSPALYDPLLLMEVLRQCGILGSHAYLDAPHGSAFVFDRAELTIVDIGALRIGPRPAELLIDFRIVETKKRGGKVAGAVYEVLADLDGRPAVRARLACRWMPRRTWQALRDRSRAGLELTPRAHITGLRLPTYLVGRRSAQNVVLADAVVEGSEAVGHVVVDQAHPGLFDHPLDHIPGAVMFEAFRQTALYASSEVHGLAPRGLYMESLRTDFAQVAEFELPTDCRARVGALTPDGVTVESELVQEDRVIASATLRLGRTLCPAASAPAEERLVSA
ncbi:ScbA/BarX family gamma-butyrolactone biosynthesis protein [Streptomyces sp. N35]|uniref:ScbA/BarX family gamma-butyrolactone biosynthesis protein n=1 Tax=Streptomyces sp. N35 TaxID=2795730 RepID=UPI0018F2EF90|nr:ScbA/BarX family gamma-butyrolactone biosynthesis protein [Streptomyces sp. N35]